MMNGIKPRKEDYRSALMNIAGDKHPEITGVNVEIRNMRIFRREKTVIADVIYHDTFDRHTERYNDEEYPLPGVEKEAERIRVERIKVKKGS